MLTYGSMWGRLRARRRISGMQDGADTTCYSARTATPSTRRGVSCCPPNSAAILEEGAVLTKGEDGCLELFPNETWAEEVKGILNDDRRQVEVRRRRRLRFGEAHPITPDKQGTDRHPPGTQGLRRDGSRGHPCRGGRPGRDLGARRMVDRGRPAPSRTRSRVEGGGADTERPAAVNLVHRQPPGVPNWKAPYSARFQLGPSARGAGHEPGPAASPVPPAGDGRGGRRGVPTDRTRGGGRRHLRRWGSLGPAPRQTSRVSPSSAWTGTRRPMPTPPRSDPG